MLGPKSPNCARFIWRMCCHPCQQERLLPVSQLGMIPNIHNEHLLIIFERTSSVVLQADVCPNMVSPMVPQNPVVSVRLISRTPPAPPSQDLSYKTICSLVKRVPEQVKVDLIGTVNWFRNVALSHNESRVSKDQIPARFWKNPKAQKGWFQEMENQNPAFHSGIRRNWETLPCNTDLEQQKLRLNKLFLAFFVPDPQLQKTNVLLFCWPIIVHWSAMSCWQHQTRIMGIIFNFDHVSSETTFGLFNSSPND